MADGHWADADDFDAGVQTKAGDFVASQLADAYEVDNCFDVVIESHKKYALGRKSMAFTVSVKGSKALTAKFNAAGIAAAHLDGTTPREERRQLLRDFHTGKYEVLVNCLDDQTEILTRRGWVGIDDIRADDVTATMNPVTSRLEWQPISRVVRRERALSERMVRIKNKSLDVRVTEGHRMLVRAPGARSWQFVEAGALPSRRGPYELPLSAFAEPEDVGIATLPEQYTHIGRRAAARYNIRRVTSLTGDALELEIDRRVARKSSLRAKQVHELSLDECRFIGLFITDGHMGAEQRGVTIGQSEVYSDMNQRIRALLDACGFDWAVSQSKNIDTPYLQNVYRIPVGSISGDLERHGYVELLPYLDKHFNPLLFGLDRGQTIALVEGLWMGDGAKNSRPSTGVSVWRIFNTDLGLLEQVQILCLSRGLTANRGGPSYNGPLAKKPLYELRIRDYTDIATNNHSVSTSGGNPAKFEDDWRDEKVWCVTNANGTIFTRRNGYVMITGQCSVLTEGFDEPGVSCIHMVRPTRSDSLYLQTIGRGLRIVAGKADCLILDYSPAETRNLAMLGDLLGVPRKAVQIIDIEDAEDGEVYAGFSYDGQVKGLRGNPLELVARQLNYLDSSSFLWDRFGDWLILGLGPDGRGMKRMLALTPARSDAPHVLYLLTCPAGSWDWAVQALGQSEDFGELSDEANDYAEANASQILAGKNAYWMKKEPTEKALNFLRKLAGKDKLPAKLTAGDCTKLINAFLAKQALEKAGLWF